MNPPTPKTIASLMLSAIFACALAPLCARAADDAAVRDAQQKFDAGQYPDALKVIAQALSKGTPTGESPERYQLLMLRGECLIRTGQRAPAAAAFDAANKSAPDVPSAALARANALLVRASPQNKYTPKDTANPPIDITSPDPRKIAFAFFREDQARIVQPKVDKALAGTTLPPMIEVLPSLLDVAYLEYAARGNAEQTKASLMALGARARELMKGELKRVRHEIDVLEEVSNTYDGSGRRGFYSNERTSLQASHDYVVQIEQAARQARRRVMDLGFDGAVWEPIIADAADLADLAQALLSAGP
jgi:hypothetical protein